MIESYVGTESDYFNSQGIGILHYSSKNIQVGVKYLQGKKTRIKVKRMSRGHLQEDIRKRAHNRLVSIQSRSRKKEIDCTVTTDDILRIMTSPCSYCDSADNFSEIDRKDNSLGYLPHNIVPSCRRCNTVKNKYISYEEMIKVANLLGWSKRI